MNRRGRQWQRHARNRTPLSQSLTMINWSRHEAHKNRHKASRLLLSISTAVCKSGLRSDRNRLKILPTRPKPFSALDCERGVGWRKIATSGWLITRSPTRRYNFNFRSAPFYFTLEFDSASAEFMAFRWNFHSRYFRSWLWNFTGCN